MRKRGYKRKSIKSQAFREERLRILQTHSRRNKKISSLSYYTFFLPGAYNSGNHSIWIWGYEGKGNSLLSLLFFKVLYHCLYQNSAGEEQRDLSAHFGTYKILWAVMSCVFSCDCVSSAHRVWLQVTHSQLSDLDVNSLPSIMFRDIWAFCFPLDQTSVTDYTLADKALQKRGLKSLTVCYPNYPNYLIILITATN